MDDSVDSKGSSWIDWVDRSFFDNDGVDGDVVDGEFGMEEDKDENDLTLIAVVVVVAVVAAAAVAVSPLWLMAGCMRVTACRSSSLE
jgi:hypothetical protein